MTILERMLLLITVFVAMCLIWRLYSHHSKHKALYDAYFPGRKIPYACFSLFGLLAIDFTSIAESDLKRIAVPVFRGVAGLIIFLETMKLNIDKQAISGFWWVGIGGALICLGGIALAFLTSGSQLFFFSQDFALTILAPLLLLMTLAFTQGFVKQIVAGILRRRAPIISNQLA
jgi:hypothetical protein